MTFFTLHEYNIFFTGFAFGTAIMAFLVRFIFLPKFIEMSDDYTNSLKNIILEVIGSYRNYIDTTDKLVNNIKDNIESCKSK